MPAYGSEAEGDRGRRQAWLAAGVLVLSLSLGYLTDATQQRIAFALRASLLRPFIATQEALTQARLRASQVEELLQLVDSLSGVLSTQSALADENRTLRSLLELSDRAGPLYLPATVLRPGTPGSESMFLVDRGSVDGVAVGSPVLSPQGLLGVVREVRAEGAVGMDWSHPDFRASAMVQDGSAYGIVENRAGAFREEDRLVLNGTAYNEDLQEGALVITSGLGGVFPRGIPVGRIDGVAEVQGTWRKSYWLRPLVVPASATHVLVMIARAPDPSGMWSSDTLTADSAGTSTGGGR